MILAKLWINCNTNLIQYCFLASKGGFDLLRPQKISNNNLNINITHTYLGK